ncbi:hypothetical protein IJU97_03690 [bacterium]|nr:hypothetical protein [bacterium]
MFLNKRAECYWRLKTECRLGLRLIGTRDERKDLFMIKYRKTDKGLIRIMSKVEMRKEYNKSPDDADALMLTYRDSPRTRKKDETVKKHVNPFTGEVIKPRKNNLNRNYINAW